MNNIRSKEIPIEELITQYKKANSPDVLEAIVKRNKRIVFKIANAYRSCRHPLEDLLQIAYTGLIVAINRFDVDQKNKFSTFAYYCIKGEIQHYIRDNNLINFPRWLQKLNTIFSRFIVDFESKNGRYPTKEEISEGINVSVESVDEILKAREMTFYGNDDMGSAYDVYDLIDRSIIRSRSPKSFELVMEDRILLWDAIDRLKGINKKIIVLKYILGLSQEEIGKKMGISQRSVSRNLKDSLEKIKEEII